VVLVLPGGTSSSSVQVGSKNIKIEIENVEPHTNSGTWTEDSGTLNLCSATPIDDNRNRIGEDVQNNANVVPSVVTANISKRSSDDANMPPSPKRLKHDTVTNGSVSRASPSALTLNGAPGSKTAALTPTIHLNSAVLPCEEHAAEESVTEDEDEPCGSVTEDEDDQGHRQQQLPTHPPPIYDSVTESETEPAPKPTLRYLPVPDIYVSDSDTERELQVNSNLRSIGMKPEARISPLLLMKNKTAAAGSAAPRRPFLVPRQREDRDGADSNAHRDQTLHL